MPDVTLLPGDCLDLLRTLPDASVDACVTDPPAGIAFMGRAWDHDKGGRGAWVAWMTAVMAEVHRVLKPGGHAFVWALPRTAHWTATALEDAGFEIRDKVYHLFGSGFPKSLDVSKALDKAAGAERAVTGPKVYGDGHIQNNGGNHNRNAYGKYTGDGTPLTIMDTAPATDLAQAWAGWGTALKPAAEEWILARKPLAGTVAATVAQYGTGALNIDASRVGTTSTPRKDPHNGNLVKAHMEMRPWMERRIEAGEPLKGDFDGNQGRWPPNVLLQHAPGCVPAGTRQVRGSGPTTSSPTALGQGSGWNAHNNRPVQHAGYAAPDGTETVAAWVCAPGCAVAELDRQAGPRKSGERKAGQGSTQAATFNFRSNVNANDFAASEGSASRFYPVFTPDPPAPFLYCAKASRRERNAGCAGLPEQKMGSKFVASNGQGDYRLDGAPVTHHQNNHPTVKPQALMRWLCTLITPPGGTILDPFCGSGSTGVAAVTLGYSFIGCEQDAAYLAIAQARIAHAQPAQPAATQPALEMTA